MRRTMLAAVVAVLLASVLGAGCGAKAPAVSSIAPSTGAPGTQITITGTGFGADKGKSVVQFSGDAIGVKTWSDTKIIATVPSDMKAGGYVVTVVTDAGTSPGKSFDVEAAPPSPQPQQPVTQVQAIEKYATEHNLYFDDPVVKEGQVRSVALVETSAQDANWELWKMDASQGEDTYYFLLARQGLDWVVINGGLWTNQTPEDFGSPMDLTIPTAPEGSNP
ncbi:MAG: IPT/TIG domain-containing protein [Actinobacteria bacterium]|nr:IPT/TIG domain-containing protein [Actinomycetota bacterium]MBU1943450.1 IPT/TIG domain-containing protein [Actinomycetota bacterium]MBU2686807.1 IPT/TIG domain-containing protein [Actinomycetota bacterium]